MLVEYVKDEVGNFVQADENSSVAMAVISAVLYKLSLRPRPPVQVMLDELGGWLKPYLGYVYSTSEKGVAIPAFRGYKLVARLWFYANAYAVIDELTPGGLPEVVEYTHEADDELRRNIKARLKSHVNADLSDGHIDDVYAVVQEGWEFESPATAAGDFLLLADTLYNNPKADMNWASLDSQLGEGATQTVGQQVADACAMAFDDTFENVTFTPTDEEFSVGTVEEAYAQVLTSEALDVS